MGVCEQRITENHSTSAEIVELSTAPKKIELSMSNVLSVKNLKKSYRGREVVKDISLAVHTGQVVGLLGPNGAGKTTSFYMIVGLIRETSGQILLNDVEITHRPIHERAQQGIGYLPQEPSVFRKLTVKENLQAALEFQPISKDEQIKKLNDLIEEFNLFEVQNTLGLKLSGGERRRVEIARALTASPQFILLDEPFAGVDPLSVTQINQSIDDLKRRGIGVLITDHNVRETLKICDTAYIVNQGEILAHGTPHELIHNKAVREVYLGEAFAL